jgi:hypothetical protein
MGSSEEGGEQARYNAMNVRSTRPPGPVPVLCRSFDHILCSKGDEP